MKREAGEDGSKDTALVVENRDLQSLPSSHSSSGRKARLRFWRRKKKTMTNDSNKNSMKNKNGKIKQKKQELVDQQKVPLSPHGERCQQLEAKPPYPCSPPPRIQRLMVIAEEDSNFVAADSPRGGGDQPPPLKSFFPEKQYQHNATSTSSSTFSKRRLKVPMSPIESLQENGRSRSTSIRESMHYCKGNFPSTNHNKTGGVILLRKNGESMPGDPALGRKKEPVEIFSSPHGHDDDLAELEVTPKQEANKKERPQNGKNDAKHQVGKTITKDANSNQKKGDSKKGFLQLAKESVSTFAEEIKEFDKEGFFFCVGDGCGDILYDGDSNLSDDFSFDADDLKMLNETFMSGLTCVMDDNDSDQSDLSSEDF